MYTYSVEAIGTFGLGELFGNYIKDHYILNPWTGDIEQNGPVVELINRAVRCVKNITFYIKEKCLF